MTSAFQAGQSASVRFGDRSSNDIFPRSRKNPITSQGSAVRRLWLSNSSQLGFEATLKVLEKYGYPSITMDDFHAGTRYTIRARFVRHIKITGSPEHGPGGSWGGEQRV